MFTPHHRLLLEQLHVLKNFLKQALGLLYWNKEYWSKKNTHTSVKSSEIFFLALSQNCETELSASSYLSSRQYASLSVRIEQPGSK